MVLGGGREFIPGNAVGASVPASNALAAATATVAATTGSMGSSSCESHPTSRSSSTASMRPSRSRSRSPSPSGCGGSAMGSRARDSSPGALRRLTAVPELRCPRPRRPLACFAAAAATDMAPSVTSLPLSGAAAATNAAATAFDSSRPPTGVEAWRGSGVRRGSPQPAATSLSRVGSGAALRPMTPPPSSSSTNAAATPSEWCAWQSTFRVDESAEMESPALPPRISASHAHAVPIPSTASASPLLVRYYGNWAFGTPTKVGEIGVSPPVRAPNPQCRDVRFQPPGK